MRLVSLVLSIIVAVALYFLIVDRTAIKDLLNQENTKIQQDTNLALSGSNDDDKMDNQKSIPNVMIAKSVARDTENNLILRGLTAAIRKVEVRSEISGSIISNPRPKGSMIKTGEVLCEIAAGTRYVTLSEAKVRLLEAEKKARVLASLGEKGYSTETSNLTQKTILEAAKASLARAEYEISRLIIDAPFHGVLENNTAELGSYLTKGSLCATIIDLSKVKLIGYVPEVRIREISVGADARGKTVSGISTKGKVSFISKQADPVTKTFQVEITADNLKSQIRDGETVEIKIELSPNKAHLLPQSVLTLNDEGLPGVKVVVENKVEFFSVSILRDEVDGLLLIGLPETIDVITVGQEFVVDGQAVDTTYEKKK